MLHDRPPLAWRERRGLRQDLVGDGQLAEVMQQAEERGFEMAFFSETIELMRDSVSSLAAIGLATKKLKLGTTQIVRLRGPVVMAQSLAILGSNDSWLPLPYGRVPSAVAQPAAIPNVAADPVTIRHLLTHTSGLMTGGPGQQTAPAPARPPAARSAPRRRTRCPAPAPAAAR